MRKEALPVGIEQGMSEDEMLAATLGAKDADSLTPIQDKYKDKMKAKLAEVWTDILSTFPAQNGLMTLLGHADPVNSLLGCRMVDSSDSF